jgi:hypothetical protein
MLTSTTKTTKLVLLATCLLAPVTMRADLLVSPAGGSSITPSNPDDGSASLNLGGTFDFYGNPVDSLFFQVNGFLSTEDAEGFFDDRSITTLANDTGSSVIAPLYDDLIEIGGTSLSDLSTSNYFAATWQNIAGDADPSGGTSSFQVLLFFSAATVDGFSFQPGDIAISYGSLNDVPSGTFTVGVAQNGSNGVGNPLSSDGQLTNLSSLPAGNEFFLYRPDGNSYDVSVQETSAVPEPGSIGLVGLLMLGLPAWIQRNRSARQASRRARRISAASGRA